MKQSVAKNSFKKHISGLGAALLIFATAQAQANLANEFFDCQTALETSRVAFRPSMYRDEKDLEKFFAYKNTPASSPRTFSINPDQMSVSRDAESISFEDLSKKIYMGKGKIPFGHYMPSALTGSRSLESAYQAYEPAVSAYELVLLFLKKGDWISSHGVAYQLGDFVAMDGTSHIFRAEGQPGLFIRIPFLSPGYLRSPESRDERSLLSHARQFHEQMVQLLPRVRALGLKFSDIVEYPSDFSYMLVEEVNGWLNGRDFLVALVRPQQQFEDYLKNFDRTEMFTKLQSAVLALGGPKVEKLDLLNFDTYKNRLVEMDQSGQELMARVQLYSQYAHQFVWDQKEKEWVFYKWSAEFLPKEKLVQVEKPISAKPSQKLKEESQGNGVPPAHHFPTIKQSDIAPDPKVTNPRQAAPKKMETVNEEELKKRAQKQTSQIKPKTKYRVIPKTTEQHDRRAKPKVNTEYEIPQRPKKIIQPIAPAPWEETRDNGRLKPAKKDAARLVPSQGRPHNNRVQPPQHKNNPKQGE